MKVEAPLKDMELQVKEKIKHEKHVKKVMKKNLAGSYRSTPLKHNVWSLPLKFTNSFI